MVCPSCKKSVIEDASFCPFCGAHLSSLSSSTSSPLTESTVEWEYKDFIYNFVPGTKWAAIGKGDYTEAEAKREFWQNAQNSIRLELQKWLDKGWNPIGEIGPAGIKIRTYSAVKLKSDPVSILILLIIIPLTIVFTLGLGLIYLRGTYAEPVEFRVTMRRNKAQAPPDVLPIGNATEATICLMWGGKQGPGNAAVYIDNQRVREISYGDRELFEVSPGKHTIYVKWWSISTSTLTLVLEPGNRIDLICEVAGIANLMRLRPS